MGGMFMGNLGSNQGGFSFEGGSPVGGVFGSDSPFFGYERSRTESESQSRPDPLTQRMNEVRVGELEDILRITGGLEGLYGPKSDKAFRLDPRTRQLMNQYIAQASRPGLTPEQWYAQSKAELNPEFYTQTANRLLGEVVQPGLQQQYAAAGLGRSGALGEGLAKAGAQLAQPIAQQYLGNLFALNQQRPNVEVSLRQANLGRLGQAFQSADIQRQLELQNLQRKTAGVTGAFNLVPYVAGQDSRSTQSQFGNIVMDLLNMVLSSGIAQAAIGAMTGMPSMGGMGGGGGGGNAGPVPSSTTGVQAAQLYPAPAIPMAQSQPMYSPPPMGYYGQMPSYFG